jgi:plastocyanin
MRSSPEVPPEINNGPAGADYFPTTTPTTEESTTPSADLPVLASVVTYSATGFSPNSLTVKAGTTVTFKNDTSGSMWGRL